MQRAVLTIVFASLASSLALAQTVACSTQVVGSTAYTLCSNGYRVSSLRVGKLTYTYDSQGTTSTTQSVGAWRYYNDSRGVIGSSQRIGQMEYLNFQSRSGSAWGTYRRAGQFEYLTVHTSQGGWLTGTNQRIGSFIYGTYQIYVPR
jgi:hypothetical protein